MACLVLAQNDTAAAGKATAEAAGHAGIAYGLSRRLAAMGRELAGGRCIVPADRLAAHGLSAEAMFEAPPPAAALAVVAELADKATGHLDSAMAAVGALPAQVKPAFLPLVAVRPLIARIRAAGPSIFATPVAVSDLAVLARMLVAAIRPPRARRSR